MAVLSNYLSARGTGYGYSSESRMVGRSFRITFRLRTTTYISSFTHQRPNTNSSEVMGPLWVVVPVQRTGEWWMRESVAPRFLTGSSGLGIRRVFFENRWRSPV